MSRFSLFTTRPTSHRRTPGPRLRPVRTTVALLSAGIVAAGAAAVSQSPATSLTSTQSDAYSIWSNTDVPKTPADPDTAKTTVGVKFSSSVAGSVTGIRFYQASENVGPHVGQLWTAKGQLLAKVTFPSSSTAGWKVAQLSTPVKISPSTKYVASYTAPSGRYADDVNALSPTHPKVTRDLTAWRGVYSYGSTVPNQTWNDSNYFVDVLFAPDSTNPAAPVATASSTPTTSSDPTASTSPSPSTSTTTSADTSTTSSSPTTTTSSAPATSTSPTPTTTTTTTASTTGCAAKPSSCGYPDATNTGVPAGTTLRAVPGDITSGPGWHVDSRGWIAVDTDGAVLDGISTNLNVEVTASNVTIKNSRITVTGDTWAIGLRHTKNATIENNEISSPAASGTDRLAVAIKDVYGDATGTQVLRNNIWHADTGIQTHEGLIQDNYLHDFGLKDGDHINGTTSNGSTVPLTIRHNTIFNQISQTDAVSLFQDFGVEANRIIDNNLLAGGGYTIYGGAGQYGQTHDIVITNNRIARIYYPNGGGYGPVTAYDPSGTGNTWTGNIWDDTGKPIPAP